LKSRRIAPTSEIVNKPLVSTTEEELNMSPTRNETFTEFTFEAAHTTPPFSGLHGHSFRVEVFLKGTPDPTYGWSHNLYEVSEKIDALKRVVDHKYLNDIDGLEVPSLENVARWVWRKLASEIPGVDRVIVRRGHTGQTEGCCYAGDI
jgi:6-pyruvoyltetrahydropterin/6-carboxytetrahydropterin synthase